MGKDTGAFNKEYTWPRSYPYSLLLTR